MFDCAWGLIFPPKHVEIGYPSCKKVVVRQTSIRSKYVAQWKTAFIWVNLIPIAEVVRVEIWRGSNETTVAHVHSQKNLPVSGPTQLFHYYLLHTYLYTVKSSVGIYNLNLERKELQVV